MGNLHYQISRIPVQVRIFLLRSDNIINISKNLHSITVGLLVFKNCNCWLFISLEFWNVHIKFNITILRIILLFRTKFGILFEEIKNKKYSKSICCLFLLALIVFPVSGVNDVCTYLRVSHMTSVVLRKRPPSHRTQLSDGPHPPAVPTATLRTTSDLMYLLLSCFSFPSPGELIFVIFFPLPATSLQFNYIKATMDPYSLDFFVSL